MRWIILGGLIATFGLSPAQAAKLTAKDRAWIESCVKLRIPTKEKRRVLQRYCGCMMEFVEDRRPLGITELERSFPPAHRLCRRQAGRR
ncbi:hypothetical protein GJW-30_1_02421 [Variibacter gotjawalensis]|uniref:Uncharacterized protein n=1 Tax=Variibacter gotjawalensis TaxID=1333996 RepID=A0A0S3PVL9_9BRAD|nr:hypothetical protein [Variibacter gotjawalensis]NIK45708.1 hypothetical protein [Variibacter gotjawalensis]RZS47634.1 hypothetical protein EV661_0024 [Variibacter gotjawalensis]BAT59886.1 hypothetical protein GJW-30_1_02421 [Variibacter gotjawalensis]